MYCKCHIPQVSGFLKYKAIAAIYQDFLEHFMLRFVNKLHSDADFISLQMHLSYTHLPESVSIDYHLLCETNKQTKKWICRIT